MRAARPAYLCPKLSAYSTTKSDNARNAYIAFLLGLFPSLLNSLWVPLSPTPGGCFLGLVGDVVGGSPGPVVALRVCVVASRWGRMFPAWSRTGRSAVRMAEVLRANIAIDSSVN